MPTFNALISQQTVSPDTYGRLRDSFIQQGSHFQWVITESHLSTHPTPHLNSRNKSNRYNNNRYNNNRHNNSSDSRGPWHLPEVPTAAASELIPLFPVDDLPVESFVLLQSSALSVLMTAETLADAHRPYRQESAYRLSLTFDDQTISDFIESLPSAFLAQLPGEFFSLFGPQQSLSSPRALDSRNLARNKPARNKSVTQETFVLAWAKQLATLSEHPPQPTQTLLEKQIQQSLLLDQVITRIRHSLDLSTILETTAAQVREFLGADRLVVYQFDQIDVPESVSAQPTLTVEPLASTASASEPSSVQSPAQHRAWIADSPQNHPVLLRRRVTSGHITYESRCCEEITSVLNSSEQNCFAPSHAGYSRYLLGQPIAVDNVEEQYAHAPCLLAFLQQAQVKSKIIAPILVQDQLWGLLIAHQCRHLRHWEETEAIFLQHIAEHLSVAIDQAALYRQLRQQAASLESCVIERTQNLHDALKAAESANVTKDEFLSTMSHELRTPLTYIIGMSATLLRWSLGDLNDRQRSYLTTINQSGERLLAIINDILEFAKLESGRSLLEVSEFSIHELADEIIAHFQPMAVSRHISLNLSCEGAPEQANFMADIERLRQALSNLIHNAIKFTPSGGEVTLTVRKDAAGVIFDIEDTGIGIPLAQQDVLFETFKQLESPFKRQYPGTGLGLAMTKRLVELHGGNIQVESQEGRGSTFSVWLPIKPVSRPPRSTPLLSQESQQKRVVLLDQDDNTAAVVCEMLTAASYEVIWLLDPKALLAQLELLKPAILIADLSLFDPHKIKLQPIQLSITALEVKVLALVEKGDAVSSLMAHHDLLHRPIDPKALLEKVRHLSFSPR